MLRHSTQPSRNTLLAGVVALAILPSQVQAATCYSFYRGYYECGTGLANGARIGIGIGIAAGILILSLLLSLWIRKRRMRKFRQQAQALPTINTQSYPSNYQSNYPQPQNSYYTAQFQPPAGAPPLSKPPQTYQPSSAGQYGGVGREHDYEYQQAEENRRLEEDAGRMGDEPPPPTYDAVTGRKNTNTFQPPVGPPPGQLGANAPAGGGVV